MTPVRKGKAYVQIALACMAMLMIGVLLSSSMQTGSDGPGVHGGQAEDYLPVRANTELQLVYQQEPTSLQALLKLSETELGQVDIARVNLLCALGLPGAEGIDINGSLKIIDAWAEHVARETDRYLYRVNDPRHADHYRHSEAYYRAEMLLQVLQQDVGIRYDLTAVDSFSFKDPRVA